MIYKKPELGISLLAHNTRVNGMFPTDCAVASYGPDDAACFTIGARFSGGGLGNAECSASSRLASVATGKAIPKTRQHL